MTTSWHISAGNFAWPKSHWAKKREKTISKYFRPWNNRQYSEFHYIGAGKAPRGSCQVSWFKTALPLVWFEYTKEENAFSVRSEKIMHNEWRLFCRLRDEIEQVIGNVTYLRYEHISNLKFMSMVMKESMRLYPTAPSTFRKLNKPSDIAGYLIPQNTIIMVTWSTIIKVNRANLHNLAPSLRLWHHSRESTRKPIISKWHGYA